MKRNTSIWVYMLCCLLLFCGTFTSQDYSGKKPNTTISWDIFGYYLYLPSLFYDDLGKLEKLPHLLDTYQVMNGPQYQAVKQPNGNYIMKYSSGMAVMYLPAFAIGHMWAKAAGYPVDGMSFPYQASVNFWGLIIAFIGLWFCRKILLRYFSDTIVSITLLTLVLATNYSFYASWCTTFSHNYLFTIYTLILYLTIRWHEKPSYRKSIVLGLLCGLAALTRPTDIICILIHYYGKG